MNLHENLYVVEKLASNVQFSTNSIVKWLNTRVIGKYKEEPNLGP